jgi:glutamyl-tRNA synthetase
MENRESRSGIRTRFSPSPTGSLHIGNVRTALYSWLYARSRGGEFYLRIEDTDQERSTEEAIRVIYEGLEWLGIDHDNEPERQSEQRDRYRRRAEELIAGGKAYKCYCTPEELKAMRDEQTARKETPRYDRRCRNRTEFPEDRPYVVRLKVDPGETITFNDLVYGEISVETKEIDDFVLLRPNGYPIYNYACAVDDHEMGITTVIRGQDGLSNTPRQICVYKAFGWEIPEFAHVPFILGPDGSKLSKRHGAVSLQAYKEMGFLPDAFINYLARLGWSHGDQEIFTREELIRLFDLKEVNKSASRFDYQKALWLNGEHIRIRSAEELAPLFINQLVAQGVVNEGQIRPDERFLRIVESLKGRSKTLVEMVTMGGFFFLAEPRYDEMAVKKNWGVELAPCLEALIGKLAALGDSPPVSAIEEALRKTAEEFEISMKKFAQAVRVALTGSVASPPLDEVILLLGPEKVLKRLEYAVNRMRQ